MAKNFKTYTHGSHVYGADLVCSSVFVCECDYSISIPSSYSFRSVFLPLFCEFQCEQLIFFPLSSHVSLNFFLFAVLFGCFACGSFVHSNIVNCQCHIN